MSTKSSVFYQEAPDDFDRDENPELKGEIHIYHEPGIHMPMGMYIEVNYDMVRIENVKKFIDQIAKLKEIPGIYNFNWNSRK